MTAKSKIDHFTITVYGEKWNVYKVDSNDDVLIDEGSDAEISLLNREIYIKKPDLVSIRHELFHLYLDYTYTSSANLAAEQMEEITCDIFAYKGDEITKLAEEILQKIKTL